MSLETPLTPEQIAEQAATFASVLARIDRGDDDLADAVHAATISWGTDALVRFAERTVVGFLQDWVSTLQSFIERAEALIEQDTRDAVEVLQQLAQDRRAADRDAAWQREAGTSSKRLN